jgi:hypothetical protein
LISGRITAALEEDANIFSGAAALNVDLIVLAVIFAFYTDHTVSNQLTAMLDAASFLEKR